MSDIALATVLVLGAMAGFFAFMQYELVKLGVWGTAGVLIGAYSALVFGSVLAFKHHKKKEVKKNDDDKDEDCNCDGECHSTSDSGGVVVDAKGAPLNALDYDFDKYPGYGYEPTSKVVRDVGSLKPDHKEHHYDVSRRDRIERRAFGDEGGDDRS